MTTPHWTELSRRQRRVLRAVRALGGVNHTGAVFVVRLLTTAAKTDIAAPPAPPAVDDNGSPQIT